MNTEEDLRATLRAHERLAPDAAPVAARITAGVRTRRRHRYAGTVAVAVATAVAITVPMAVLRNDAAPVPVQAATAPRTTTPAPAAVRFTPLTVPFTVGWLPAGWYDDGAANTSPGMATRSYEKRGTFDVIEIELWDTKISGRPPTDGPGYATSVRRQVSATVWLRVSARLPMAQLNRILRSVDVPAPRALTFPFRLTWVPAGFRPTSAGSSAIHWLGNASGGTDLSDPPMLDSGLSFNGAALNIGVGTENGTWEDKGIHPNGTLLGSPAFYDEDNGEIRLHVFGVHGMHITVYTNVQPGVNRAAVERLVTGLQLVAHPDRPSGWTTHPLP